MSSDSRAAATVLVGNLRTSPNVLPWAHDLAGAVADVEAALSAHNSDQPNREET